MKNLERILAALIILALIFKYFLIPFGGVIITVSLTFLALLYYPVGVWLFNGVGFRQMFRKSSYKGLSAWRILGSVVVGFTLSVLSLAILFKVQLWPGSETMLLVGVTSSAVVLVVSLIRYFDKKELFYRRIITRTLVFGIIGAVLFLLGPYDLERVWFRDHPQYLEAIDRYLENPESETLRERMNLEHMKATMTQEELEYHLENRQ